MKQTPWSICIVATLAFAMISCKSSSSLGSSKVLQDSTETYTQAQSDDCLAWKFTIMATLNHMIWQKTMHLITEQKRKDNPGVIGDHGSYYKLIDMNKIFPPETASTVLNTIIAREGGSCNKELLYDTPCIFHVFHSRGGAIKAGLISGEFDLEYFTRSVGIATKGFTIASLAQFLQKHISESPNTESHIIEYSVSKERPEGKTDFHSSITGAGFTSEGIVPCNEWNCIYDPKNRMKYQIRNNFGVCMIKKHQDYFTDNKIFDFSPYHDFINNEEERIDAESLQSFIKRSHELSGKPAQNAE